MKQGTHSRRLPRLRATPFARSLQPLFADLPPDAHTPFGVGAGSKIAMAAISCFFPIAISAAGGMRGIDAVLIRVGRSFRAGPWQMASKIYLPAMRAPVLNGLRLGLGVAIIALIFYNYFQTRIATLNGLFRIQVGKILQTLSV